MSSDNLNFKQSQQDLLSFVEQRISILVAVETKMQR